MRDQPTSWFAGTYDDLCEEDEEYYRRARERAMFSAVKPPDPSRRITKDKKVTKGKSDFKRNP